MRTGITELSILICLAGFSIFLFGSAHQIVLAAPEVDSLSGNLEAGDDDKVIANKRKTGVLLAQKKVPKKRSAKARKRILSDEKVLKSKKGRSKTNLDFDAVDISGQRKTPLVVWLAPYETRREAILSKSELDGTMKLKSLRQI